jgi:hypothetical protein
LPGELERVVVSSVIALPDMIAPRFAFLSPESTLEIDPQFCGVEPSGR